MNGALASTVIIVANHFKGVFAVKFFSNYDRSILIKLQKVSSVFKGHEGFMS